jgi:hypothetical protein
MTPRDDIPAHRHTDIRRSTLGHMRTTIRLPDELYRAVQARAAEQGRTVTSFIAQSVREQLAKPSVPSEGPAFSIKPFSGNGTLPGIELADSASLLERMEG